MHQPEMNEYGEYQCAECDEWVEDIQTCEIETDEDLIHCIFCCECEDLA